MTLSMIYSLKIFGCRRLPETSL